MRPLLKKGIFGRLAQLVQSAWFTPRRSGVRISHRPLFLKPSWIDFHEGFFYPYIKTKIMQTYIAILRGINVSGKNKIKMDALRSMLEGLDIENVQTYIQSGNIVFQKEATDGDVLAQMIHEGILEHFDLTVPVIIRTKEEWESTIQNNPFTPKGYETNKQYFLFLNEAPDAALVEKLKEQEFAPDEWEVKGKELYFYCPGSYGRTKFSNNFFERKLKVTATTRNWKTVQRLMEMAGGCD